MFLIHQGLGENDGNGGCFYNDSTTSEAYPGWLAIMTTRRKRKNDGDDNGGDDGDDHDGG